MKKSRFTEVQIVSMLREADRTTVAAVAKEHGVSEQTLYTWRKRFGVMETNDVKRLRQLELDNGRLKKLVAERDLQIEVMKEIAVKRGERTCSSQAGRLRQAARLVRTAGVYATECGTIITARRFSASGIGYTGDVWDGDPVSAVSPLWLSAHSDILGGASGA